MAESEHYLGSDGLFHCDDDFDCPVGAVCFQNVSWNKVESFCDCNSWYGFTSSDGVTCDGFASSTAAIKITVTSTMALVNIGLLRYALPDALTLLRIFRSESNYEKSLFKKNANLVVSSCIFIALVCHLGWQMTALFSVLFPSEFKQRAAAGRTGEKYSSFNLAQRPFLILCLLFAYIAAVHVSVMWLEMVYRVIHLRDSNPGHRLERYRHVVIATELVFCLAITCVAAIGRYDLCSVVAMPFIFSTALSYALGRHHMVKLMRMSIEADSDSTMQSCNTKTDTADRKESASQSWFDVSLSDARKYAPLTGRGLLRMCFHGRDSQKYPQQQDARKGPIERKRRALLAISRVSFHVILALLSIVLAGVLFFALSSVNPDAGWREWAQPGKTTVMTFVSTALDASVLYLIAAVLRYSHRSSVKIVRQHNGESASFPNNGQGGDKKKGARGLQIVVKDTDSEYQSSSLASRNHPNTPVSFSDRL